VLSTKQNELEASLTCIQNPGSTLGRDLGGHGGSDNAGTKPDWLLEG